MNDSIEIRGAKEHNLKNISLSIPHKTLTTLTGVSGSGKSSLAFDTIFKEGQRRYLESLSAYARQFLGVMAKADVEHIEGLSPTISIDQKSVNKNPRSTVGTVTEIYDFFRLLFARLGTPYCSKCGHKISKQSEDQIAQTILRDFKDKRLLILAPIVRDRKGEYRKEIEEVKNAGYQRIRIDNIVYKFEDDIIPELKRYEKHTLEIVIDRIKTEDKYLSRITDDIERAIRITKGLVAFYEEHEIIEEENLTEEKTKRKKTKISKQSEIDKYYRLYTTERSCANCGHSIADIEPNLFSFNNPMGACSICGGLGVEHIFTEKHIIKDENLNIYEGALSCFVDNHIGFDMEYGFEELEIIAKIYNINLKNAWKDLSKNEKKYLLYGSDKEVKWKKRFWYHSKIVEEKIPGILTRLKYDYETYKISYYANFMDEVECPKCKGKRINEDALAVRFDGKTIADFSSMTIEDLFNYFSKLKLKPNEEIIGKPIIKEIIYRLTFLVKVGLTYLTIERASPTLSGGESQRIRLASQIGSGLEGVLYVLDEPSIGLHQSDNKKLIESLKTLRDKNNTVIVVEHDKETMEESDYLIDIGLDAGVSGGNIVGIGNFNEFIKSEKSYTAKYLRGDDNIPIPKNRREGNGKFLKIIGASQFNLKNIDVKIPLGLFLVVSGLSGSGKSTLVDNILMRALHNHFYGKTFNVGKHKKIEGFENIDKVIEVDQSPIGRTPRSNPATYTKVLSPIRDLFAATKLSKMRGYDKGRFSFNVKTGRCPTCEGAGLIELEMQFLSNVLVPCEECAGKRFNAETLDIKYKNKNIYEVLELTVSEAIEFFDGITSITRILKIMEDIGLGYIKLGQPSTTLSGGEAQRIRLASQLGSKLTGVLYVLDEPTVGLHPKDTGHLLDTLKELRDLKNTLVIVEHDRDTMKSADNIIDMGPYAGAFGGEIIFEGKFNDIIKNQKSLTGEYLSGIKKVFDKNIVRKENTEMIKLKNVSTNNLKNIDIEIPLKKIVVVTGVSGSGKSSLIIDTLYPALKKRKLNQYSKYESAYIPDIISDTILVDQISIVGSIRSTLISYSKVFDKIRNIFAKTQIARAKGFSAGRFSYNGKEGRCNICEGKGIRKIAMHFLSDMEIICEACGGKRYNDETLSVRFKSLNIAEVLELTVDEALKFFDFDKSITKTLSVMSEVGLGYIKLSQRLDTFSGGELQRLKLSTELSKKQDGEHIVYILDEPTTGLHFDDVNKLLIALNKLADKGHSVIIIEHNPDVIRAADYIIDLGLDGGLNGGEIIAKGTVEEILEMKKGYTWKYI